MPRSPKKPTAGEEDDTKPYAAGSAKNTPTSPKMSLVTKKWSRDDKLNILMDVIATANPDWEAISKKHEGRTANMVKDQWRLANRHSEG
jgi:hypothetical protein